MEVNFDKQTDAILRDLAKGYSFADISTQNHLDADELSAFAENVLPAKARLRAMEHLADCSNCRTLLTNLVELNAETESETIHEEVKIAALIPEIPWYRKLFAFPNLAYTMGALALVLSGTIALLVYQNSKQENMSVAQADKTYDKPTNIGGTSSEGDSLAKETYSANTARNAANVAVPMANTSSNSSSPNVPSNPTVTMPETFATPAATPQPPATTGNRPPIATSKDVEELPVDEPMLKKGGETVESKKDSEADKKVEDVKPTTNEIQTDSTSTDNNITQSQVQELPNISRNQSNVIMPDGQNTGRVMPAPQVSRKSAPKAAPKSEPENRDDRAKNKELSSNNYVVTKTVSGKTFQSLNGVWTDSAYKGGGTKTVKRGSSDYKKLETGLQNIGNSFSGTVIVVWSGKNYKIQ